MPFEQAREFVRTLGLKSWTEWGEYRKSDKKPKNIPSAPDEIYKSEGLGTGRIADQERGWSIGKIKELLRSFESRIIYGDYLQRFKPV